MRSHPRILLVDDDEAILDSLRRALELEGYEVVTAVDGAGALTSVAQSEPDAVVLDIGLPDLNGRVVAARMRPVVCRHRSWCYPRSTR